MPTIYIGGVKHTPSSETLRRMKKAGTKFSTAPPAAKPAKGNGARGVPDKAAKRAGGQTPAAQAPVPRQRGDRPTDQKKGQTSGSGSRSVAAGAFNRNVADARRMATSGSNRNPSDVADRNRMANSGSGKKPPVSGLRLPSRPPVGGLTLPKSPNRGPGGTPTKPYERGPKPVAATGVTVASKPRPVAATGNTIPSPENPNKKRERETRQAIYDRANKKRKGG